MKPYLLTTGSIFALMSGIHIWRAIAEWPRAGVDAGFMLGMTALVAIPAAFAIWAFKLLRKL